jgi:SET domain-containing protein
MKLINNWLNPKVAPRRSEKEGEGEFAIEDIKKDEILAIFGGHIMVREERNNLPEDVRFLPIGIDNEMFIGPKSIEESDDADFFNHSCEPNAGLKGQIFLVAMRDIEKGEEITFDYVMSCAQEGEKRVLFECNCGLPSCRKEITNHDWKIPELQEKYKGYFSFYIQRDIDKLNGKKS